MKLLIIGIGIIVAFLIQIPFELKSRRLLRRYWSRPCTGFKWKRRFPNASKESIREFLDLFLDAFLFKSDKRLKFAPDDKINDVYRSSWCFDADEHLFLITNLEEKYKTDFIPILEDPDLTLGQLFDITRNNYNSKNANH